MEWWLAALIIFGIMGVMMASGMLVAFVFLGVNIVGVYLFWGGELGLHQLILSIYGAVASFTLLPILLFIFMGVAMFESGIGVTALDVLDRWLGRLPGRLSLLAVGAGTLFGTLSGSSVSSTALLGTVLVPEMERRGYKKPMSIGPIIGAAGLAMMIPPSAMAVFVAALGQFSVGATLIGGIIPGLIMAVLYATYIIGRCWLQPSIAPPYEVAPTPLSDKLIATVKHVLPLGIIVFAVTGLILLGIATPSEAAATGLLGTFILAAGYRKLNWELMKKSVAASIQIGVMVLMILTGATAFSQVLAFSGVTQGLVNIILDFPLHPIMVIIVMQALYLVGGCITDPMSMMMITFPIFMPIIHALGFNPVWFGVMVLLNVEMAGTTPPFGLGLFAMKGVAPRDTTMGDIYRASLPFLVCDAVTMALMLAFPQIVLWLPGLMH